MKLGSFEPNTRLVTHLTDSSHYPLLSVLMVQMLLSKILPRAGAGSVVQLARLGQVGTWEPQGGTFLHIQSH